MSPTRFLCATEHLLFTDHILFNIIHTLYDNILSKHQPQCHWLPYFSTKVRKYWCGNETYSLYQYGFQEIDIMAFHWHCHLFSIHLNVCRLIAVAGVRCNVSTLLYQEVIVIIDYFITWICTDIFTKICSVFMMDSKFLREMTKTTSQQ